MTPTEHKTRFNEQTYYIKFIIVFTIANIIAVFALIATNGVLSASWSEDASDIPLTGNPIGLLLGLTYTV